MRSQLSLNRTHISLSICIDWTAATLGKKERFKGLHVRVELGLCCRSVKLFSKTTETCNKRLSAASSFSNVMICCFALSYMFNKLNIFVWFWTVLPFKTNKRYVYIESYSPLQCESSRSNKHVEWISSTAKFFNPLLFTSL